MALAPITGKLRRRLVLDLSMALGLGTAAAYAWWYAYHVDHVKKTQAYYAKLEKSKQ